jgi:hypothetical protein
MTFWPCIPVKTTQWLGADSFLSKIWVKHSREDWPTVTVFCQTPWNTNFINPAMMIINYLTGYLCSVGSSTLSPTRIEIFSCLGSIHSWKMYRRCQLSSSTHFIFFTGYKIRISKKKKQNYVRVAKGSGQICYNLHKVLCAKLSNSQAKRTFFGYLFNITLSYM